jgi:Na+/H+-dicarboxylate symporter
MSELGIVAALFVGFVLGVCVGLALGKYWGDTT